MANQINDGYDMPLGAKKLVVADHGGPASYANVSTSAGAGDVVNASDFGEGGFDAVLTEVAIAASGNFAVRAYKAKALNGDAISSFVLRWFSYPAVGTTGALGAEVANTTNLSAESVRLALICV